jgi:amino acid transporter
LVTVLSMRQVEVGARLLGVLLLLEMVCLLVTAVAILLHGGPEGLSWGAAFAPENVLVGGLLGSAGVSLAFALASFIGFEATAIYGEESIDPKTTVPRATYWAVALITVFFALTSFAIVTGLGASHVVDEVVKRSTVDGQALADPAAVLFSLAREFVGPGMASAMAILVISSLFAGLLAFQNSAARYLFALSRGGALPAALARVNRQGAPVHASAWVSVLTALVMAAFAVSDLDPIVQLFAWCSGVAVVAILMIEVLVSVGVWAYFRRSLEKVGAWSSTIAPLASAVLLSLGLYLLLSRFGLLTGLVMAGVDPAATAWGLSPLGWLLALLPAMVGVVGWAMAHLQPLGSNQLLKDILS